MKINRLYYKVYGKLIDHELELSPNINVFLGDNEAGKSTIFNSILTLIYGFKPSNRERHPYVNWAQNEINFSSQISNSGELFTVERSLKSMPRLNIIGIGSTSMQVYRNEPLPFVSHVSEALFEAVFHLTADDLNQFEKSSFERIQEKLIFNYGTDYLNKASDVILKLETDINALWRKDKRGNPKINQLQNEINQLKLQRHDAEKNYVAIKAHIQRIEAIDSALGRTMSEKQTLEHSMRQLRINMPIKERIERIDDLKRNIYKLDAYSQLDAKCIDKIEQNQLKIEEIRANAKRLQLEKDTLKEDLFVYTEHDEKLLNIKHEIEPLKHALSERMRFEYEAHSKLDELIKLREKISGQFKVLFDSEIDENNKSVLKKMPVLDLMSLVQKYIDGFEQNEEIDARIAAQRSRVKRGTVLLGILGAIATGIGFYFEPVRWLAFAGIGIVGYSMAHLKVTRKTESSERIDLTALKQKIEVACMTVRLPEYVLRDSSLRFFSKLEQLILLLYEEDALHEKWASVANCQKNIELNISTVMETKGFDTSRGAVLSLQYVLAQIERLTEIESTETKKRVRMAMIEALIESNQIEVVALESIERDLMTQVETFGDGDYEFGMKMIAQNTDLIRKIKVYSDELSQSHYDFEAVSIATESKLLELEAQIAENDVHEKQLYSERQRLTSEIERYNETFILEAINSQILVAEEQLEELIKHRNQLMVLLEIIKFSDERYRVENQPNIITRVSQFMRQMTHGKYQEVLITEDNGHFELQFLIDGEIVPVSRAFSKGTIQQLFFAYRLAVLEALDPNNGLPFVLDEAFVNWDSKRFVETLKLLEDVAQKRQILIFTCHQNMADQIAKCTTSKLIEVVV